MAESTRDAGRGAEPGAISRLLLEIAQAPEDDLASSWREPLEAGDSVGRYQIRREIGRGGFGAVYEAFDPDLGRVVALKALKPGRTRRRFSEEWIQKEAEAVAKLDHPAIVTIHDVGTCPAGAYLVMELLRGETLADRIGKGPVPVDEALRIAEQMAEGLAHAHSRGVLHWDLKPANVFVCEDGRVKLLDFGLAHLLGTEGSSGAGTPAYMAPEQAAGAAVDERADVYAAGMVLGEMLTGKRPVERTPSPAPGVEARTEPLWETAKPAAPAVTGAPNLGGIPRPVAMAMEAALSEDPATRPRDGAAWLTELRSARLRVGRPRRMRRLAAVGSGFVLLGLAVAGLATWRIWERQIPGGRPTVAVADFANETGDSELDGISGLLITSLEQGTQLRVLTRGRMLDVLKQLGKEDVQRIDEPLAREVGKQARANALLLASIRRLGAAYVVEMRALDPLHDEYVFTVSDRAASKAGVFDLVDRLGSAARRRLGAGSEAAAPAPRVAAITTTSPRAWDLFFRAVQAWDQARPEDAAALFQEALKEDPDFALARFRALESGWKAWGDDEQGWLSPEQESDARKQLESVELVADRLPEKERLSLRAMRAYVDRRWREAGAIRDQAAAMYPLDKEAQYFAGDVRFHSNAEQDAIPYFRRALQLDPGFRIAAQHLASAIWTLGRAGEEILWLRDQVPLARSRMEKETLASALLSADQEEEASVILREVLGDAGRWPPGAILQYWIHTGRAAEAERTIRQVRDRLAALPATGGKRPGPYAPYAFRTSLDAQGKFAESSREPYPPSLPPSRIPYAIVQRRQWAAAGKQDHVELAASTKEIVEVGGFLDRDGGGWLQGPKAAFITAGAGRFDLAGPIARRVLERQAIRDPISTERDVLVAIAAASDAHTDAPPPELVAIAAHPQIFWRFTGALLLGHYLRERGNCTGAIEAYGRARAVPWHPLIGERTVLYPFLLHSLALCHEKLGDGVKARERNDETLRLWVNADPDIPLLAEAKAMQARLALSPGSGK